MSVLGDIESDLFDADMGAEQVTHQPAAGGKPVVGLALLNQPGRDTFGGTLAVTDYTLRYPIATFPSIKKGDRITIGRTDYLVRDVPLATDDGLEAVAPLAKQF